MTELEEVVDQQQCEKADKRASAKFGGKINEWFISEVRRPTFSHTTVALVFFSVISRSLSTFAMNVGRSGSLPMLREHYKYIACKCIDAHFAKIEEEKKKGGRKIQ